MANRQFRDDLVQGVVGACMEIIHHGVKLGMGPDEVLLVQAKLNYEINAQLLMTEIVALIQAAISDKPDGGPKH